MNDCAGGGFAGCAIVCVCDGYDYVIVCVCGGCDYVNDYAALTALTATATATSFL